ncbi:MAG: efflux RND transporter periplasmic adaptor subunit [Planctomycetaceae bacterium]
MFANLPLMRVYCCLACPMLLSACARGPGGAGGTADADGGPALVRVTPIRPVRKPLTRRSEQPGQIEAYEETPLYSKVAGYLARIHVDIGDSVTGPKFDAQGNLVQPGQVLAEISVPELDDELRQKQALVGQAQAHVKQAAAAVRVAEAAQASAQSRLDEARSAVDRAQADYDRCKSEFERLSALADRGSVTRQLVDEKENHLRAANATRKEVAAKIASARAAVSESVALLDKSQADYDAAKASVRVAEAEEHRIGVLVAYAKVRAPFDGVISTRNVHTGHLIQSGTVGGKPLLVVVRTDVVRIFVDVPEVDAVYAQPESESKIRIPALSSETFRGAVTRTSWKLDSGTRTLRVEIDVNNPEGKLRPGMYAYADLKLAERPDALALPRTALWSADGQTNCFVVDAAGHVQKRVVTIGIRAGDDVEIVSGLEGNELVIGVNPAAFREGQEVEVVGAAK